MDSMQDESDPRLFLKAEADRQGLTLAELSRSLGKNHAYLQQYVERGVPKKLKEDDRLALSRRLGVPEWRLGAPDRAGEETPSVRTADVKLPARQHMEPDIPVFGSAVGGAKADFYFNGETVNLVRRPPGVPPKMGIFALYVIGDSMSPKFEENDLIFLTSARAAGIGDYVVVELLPIEDGGSHAGFLKRLKRRTPTKVVVEQYNPKKEMEFELKRVKAIHRVLTTADLLGV